MGMHYGHIDLPERRRIQQMRDAGIPVSAIARTLGRHRSSIHREIGRNFYHDPFRDKWGQCYRGYYCTVAHGYACKRRSRRAKLVLRPGRGFRGKPRSHPLPGRPGGSTGLTVLAMGGRRIKPVDYRNDSVKG